MKKQLLLLFSTVLLLSAAYTFSQNEFSSTAEYYVSKSDSLPSVFPTERHQIEAKVSVALLARWHYKGIDMDDSLSAVALSNFIERMDRAKIYFTLQEVQDIREKYAHKLDNMIKSGELQPVYDMYSLYRQRLLEYVTYTRKWIDKGFNFDKKEHLNADFKQRIRSETKIQMEDLWRRSTKNEMLNLKINGKKEEDIKEVLHTRRNRLRSWAMKINQEEVFENFMSAVTESFDPHSNYFSASHAESFNIEMSKSLEGIGARLRADIDYTTVVELIPGGPAFKSQQIEPTDRIVSVAQGEKDEFVDIIGWRISEVVQLIRGKKGTIVRLRILSAKALPDELPKEVRLVRDKINIEEGLATQKIYDIERSGSSYTLGVITLPSFYMDIRGGNKKKEDEKKSASKDVQRIIEELRAAKVDGILIDLRKNGGGVLSEAIKLTGLFIESGPIVQIKNYKQEISLQSDKDSFIAYEGPLLVLVDRFSASASEIFAGAIQDYSRGIIAGESTFGKGSVQNILRLKDYLSSDFFRNKKVGEVKLTVAQYYRVSGSSTQKKGVTPDLLFPSQFDETEYRERSQASALAWDKLQQLDNISAGSTSIVSQDTRNLLQNALKKDLKDTRWLSFISEAEKYNLEKKKLSTLSLNYDIRKKELSAPEEKETVEKKKTLDKDNYLRQGLWLLADLAQIEKNPVTSAKR